MKIRLKLSCRTGMWGQKYKVHSFVCEYPGTKKLLDDLRGIIYETMSHLNAIRKAQELLICGKSYIDAPEDLVVFYHIKASGSKEKLADCITEVLDKKIEIAGLSLDSSLLIHQGYDNTFSYRPPTVIYY